MGRKKLTPFRKLYNRHKVVDEEVRANAISLTKDQMDEALWRNDDHYIQSIWKLGILGLCDIFSNPSDLLDFPKDFVLLIVHTYHSDKVISAMRLGLSLARSSLPPMRVFTQDEIRQIRNKLSSAHYAMKKYEKEQTEGTPLSRAFETWLDDDQDLQENPRFNKCSIEEIKKLSNYNDEALLDVFSSSSVDEIVDFLSDKCNFLFLSYELIQEIKRRFADPRIQEVIASYN